MRNLKGVANFALAAVMLACAAPVTASVFYKFIVAAETPTGGFTGFGNGPSINDKGKAAFIGQFAGGPSVMLWTPCRRHRPRPQHAVAQSLVRRRRAHQQQRRGRDLEPAAAARLVRDAGVPRGDPRATARSWCAALRAARRTTCSTSSRRSTTHRVLEDRLNGLPGDKDGVCDAGEVCVSQVAFNAFRSGPAALSRHRGAEPDRRDSTWASSTSSGSNTSQSRPAMADDGRIVVRGLNATDPILLFNYTLGAPSTIAGSAAGFTALGRAPGITSDGKVIAFAANRGKGDGVFLSIQLSSGTRRVVRIVGENAVVQKAELGVDGIQQQALLQLDRARQPRRRRLYPRPQRRRGQVRGRVVHRHAERREPDQSRNRQLRSCSRRRRGFGRFASTSSPLHRNMCVVRVPGVAGNPFTLLGDDQLVAAPGDIPHVSAGANGYCETENTDATETLFSRSSPLPVVQIGDTIKSAAVAHGVGHLRERSDRAGELRRRARAARRAQRRSSRRVPCAGGRAAPRR